jgi:hypothetical protein
LLGVGPVEKMKQGQLWVKLYSRLTDELRRQRQYHRTEGILLRSTLDGKWVISSMLWPLQRLRKTICLSMCMRLKSRPNLDVDAKNFLPEGEYQSSNYCWYTSDYVWATYFRAVNSVSKMLVGKEKNINEYLHFRYRTKAVDHISLYSDLNYWLLTCRIELQRDLGLPFELEPGIPQIKVRWSPLFCRFRRN